MRGGARSAPLRGFLQRVVRFEAENTVDQKIEDLIVFHEKGEVCYIIVFKPNRQKTRLERSASQRAQQSLCPGHA